LIETITLDREEANRRGHAPRSSFRRDNSIRQIWRHCSSISVLRRRQGVINVRIFLACARSTAYRRNQIPCTTLAVA